MDLKVLQMHPMNSIYAYDLDFETALYMKFGPPYKTAFKNFIAAFDLKASPMKNQNCTSSPWKVQQEMYPMNSNHACDLDFDTALKIIQETEIYHCQWIKYKENTPHQTIHSPTHTVFLNTATFPCIVG